MMPQRHRSGARSHAEGGSDTTGATEQRPRHDNVRGTTQFGGWGLGSDWPLMCDDSIW